MNSKARGKVSPLLAVSVIILLFLALSTANVWAWPSNKDAAPRWTIPTYTPTAVPNTGIVCVQVYRDRNHDGVRQSETEELLLGARLELRGLVSGLVFTGTTATALAPYCFRDLPPDTYLVREEDPPGYGSTTTNVWGAIVLAGTAVSVPFGDVLEEPMLTHLPLVLKLTVRSR